MIEQHLRKLNTGYCIKALVLCFYTFCLCDQGTANAVEPQELVTDKVFTIQSSDSKHRGNGFIFNEGIIATTSHLVNHLCHDNDCSNLLVLDNNEVIVKPTETIKLISDIQSLDVAFLSFKTNKEPLLMHDTAIDGKGVLYAAGINKNEIVYQSGLITKDTPIWLYTSIKTQFGLSGAPVVDKEGKLVGMVDQASSIFESVVGRIFNSPVKIRIIKASILKELLTSEADSINAELEKINEYYLNNIVKISSFERLFPSMELLSMYLKAKERIGISNIDSSFINPFLAAANKPLIIGEVKNNKLAETIERAALMESIERHGIQDLTISKIEKLNRNQEQKDLLKNLVKEIVSIHYPGYEAMVFSLSVTAILIGFMGIVWALTVGYTFGNCKGVFLKRIWISFVVAFLLWPISFLVYLLKYKNKK